MSFRRKIALSLLLTIVLGGVAFAQVVNILDPNMRVAIHEALKLPAGAPITRDDMRRLTHLGAYNRGIVNLSGLETATNLIGLALDQNALADLSPLTHLTSLRSLILPDCQINDISSLSSLTLLEELNVRRNPISDLSPLAHLNTLKYLDLSKCLIVDIAPLSHLVNLKVLQLDHNQIVDVRPLSTLLSLRKLEINHNLITDYSPLDSLSLDIFYYDQFCDIPPLPLEPRLENRKYPSIAARWSGYGWPPVRNRPELSDAENIALHDLWFHGDEFGLRMRDINNTITLSGNLDEAVRRRDELRTLNPNLVILMSYSYAAAHFNEFPEDSPYWIRNDDGTIFRPYNHTGVPKPYALIDFTHPDIQDRIVQWAVAVSKCGLYDGIFFDSWSEEWPILSAHDEHGVLHVFRSLEAERQARVNIVQRIRAATRPEFLIMGNTNDRLIPRTGPYMNGGFMEVGTPEGDSMLKLNEPLLWLEQNLRVPQINVLEGGTVPNEPADSPTNLRWMRAFTTLTLTHSDGYIGFIDRIIHNAHWYDFWDADLGRPLSEAKAQLYENREGLYIREFTNGWAVYNHTGAPQVITLLEEVQGVASGLAGTEHALANLDGEMYLRVKPKNPADVNRDGVVNILDLTIIAQAFGTDSLEGDVNGDGVVNVIDLVFVANQF